MGRRRNLAKKVHAKKLRHAREKIALFRQGKLTLKQLPALARRILQKGDRVTQSVVAPSREKVPAAVEGKEKPKTPPASRPQTST